MFSPVDDQAAYERNSLTVSSAASAAAGNQQRLGLNIVVSEGRVASPLSRRTYAASTAAKHRLGERVGSRRRGRRQGRGGEKKHPAGTGPCCVGACRCRVL